MIFDQLMNHRVLGFICLFSMLILTIPTGCSPQPQGELPMVEISELEKREDGLYLKSSGEKLDGWLVEYYPEENKEDSVERQLKSKSRVRGGVLEGISEGWFPSGAKQVEEHFVDGVSHGKRTKWYSSGQKQSEEEIAKGAIHGLVKKWHENGQLAEEMTLVQGKPDGIARSWDEEGNLKAEVELEMGEVIRQSFKQKNSAPDPASDKN